MATRKIVDLEFNNEKVYPKTHAKSTFLSDGSSVEDSIIDLRNNGGTGSAYTQGNGIVISGTEISHYDANSNITTDTSYGQAADASQSSNGSLTFKVPQILVDNLGHIKNVSERTIKVIDSDTNTWRPIKVNGISKITSTSSAPLDISAGTDISINFDDENNKVVISYNGTSSSEISSEIPSEIQSYYNVNLDPGVVSYVSARDMDFTLYFNNLVTAVTNTTQHYTVIFELTSGFGGSINFPSNVDWVNAIYPQFSANHVYQLSFIPYMRGLTSSGSGEIRLLGICSEW